jgi:arginine decarboxylase
MLKRQVDKATKADSVRPREGVAMVDLYERLIRGRTYLIPEREEKPVKPVKLKKVRPKGK